MAPCRPEARDRARAAARALECDERVIGTDTLGPRTGPEPTWTLEATLEPRAGGCPPAMQRELAARDLTARTERQGLYWRVVAVA